MVTTSEVIESWFDQPGSVSPDHCLDPNHPLGVFTSIDNSKPAFTLVTPADPRRFIDFPSNAVEIRFGRRGGDDRWTCTIELQNVRLEYAFAELIAALVNNSADASSADDALFIIGQTLDELRLLFDRRRTRKLNLEQIRGLVAELWCLTRVIEPRIGIAAATNSWRGPLGADQDFAFGGNRYMEVKSRRWNKPQIRVASPEQLDLENGELMLAVAAFDEIEGDGEAGNPVHVAGLVRSIEENPTTEARTVAVLHSSLEALGVDLDDPIYSETAFTTPVVSSFRVGSDFPLLRRSSIPAGIEDVSYTLSLESMGPFKADWFETSDED